MTRSELVAKRDNALLRIEANRSNRPRGESDSRYYEDCIDAVWAAFYQNLKAKGAEK
jgi:hypothetical protein